MTSETKFYIEICPTSSVGSLVVDQFSVRQTDPTLTATAEGLIRVLSVVTELTRFYLFNVFSVKRQLAGE